VLLRTSLFHLKKTLLSGERQSPDIDLLSVNKQEDHIKRNIVLLFIINQLQYKIAI
jgi:hypothetical protein